MTTDHKPATPGREEAELERLLREFFVAEMPAALRDATVPAVRRGAPAAAGTAAPNRRPAAGILGLTAVLASLMLALSAALWMPRTAQPPTRGGGSGGSADHTTAGTPDAAADPARSGAPSALPSGPVELQGRPGAAVPAGSPAGEEGDTQFPELDIRIIPIEDR